MASSLTAPVAGMANLDSNKIVASMASFSTAPVNGMPSLGRSQEQIVAGMTSFSTAPVAGMASLNKNSLPPMASYHMTLAGIKIRS